MVMWKEGNVLFSKALNTFLFMVIWKEGNVLFNDALNTFLFMVIWKERFYLTIHSTHFIYGYVDGVKCFI